MVLVRARRGGTLVPFLLVLLLAATPLAAQKAPATPPSPKAMRMLDVRVNAHEAYDRLATARGPQVRAGLARAGETATSIQAAIELRRATIPGLEARLSQFTAGPELVRNASGPLTAASFANDDTIVRGFLRENANLYGLSSADLNDLVTLGDSPGGASGLRMLRLEQRIDGRPIFQSETRFLIDRFGRLISSVGRLFPQARVAVIPIGTDAVLTPQAAVVRLLGRQGVTVDPAKLTQVRDVDGMLTFDQTDDFIKGQITAREVLFPVAPGVLVPAWSLVVFTTGEADWYAVVDAQTGDLLWRKNIRAYASAHDARFRVYVSPDGVTPADSPAPLSPSTAAVGSGFQAPAIAPTIVSMHTAMNPTYSPNGWINDCPAGGCTANETQTLGNNVLVCLDLVQSGGGADVCDTTAAGVIDGNGRPTGNPDANARNRDFLGTTPRDFQTGFLPPPQGGNPEAGQTVNGNGNNGTLAIDQFRRGMMTHLFYVSNWYHDKVAALGFDESSGNFQQTNFSGLGLGNDRVNADADDGGDTDNANFSTPPDGSSGRMQMYRFTGPTIDRDGGLDAEIVMHELTHGLSNRLVGNAAGLNWDPAAGMGEGWSDFYATSLLNGTASDDPMGKYALGAYATYKLLPTFLDNYVYGIRRFPLSADKTINPLTWADTDEVTNDLSGGIAPDPTGANLGGSMEVHNIGEVWSNTLWDVRARVIADPAGANGSVPVGNQKMLQLVTDALKMTPIDPSYTDARDAILNADCATNSCANEVSIWAGFANRGLGYKAYMPFNIAFGYVSAHGGLRESTRSPYLDVVNALTDVTIDDSVSNNNGAIDPGELVRITAKLFNPWRASSKSVAGAVATLTTSTPGVVIFDNTSTYGAIAAQGSATGDSFLFSVPSSMTAGSPINFSMSVVSTLGTTTTTFQLRVGKRNGTDPVVTYTGTPATGLTVTNNRPRGVQHSITITDDLVIADLNFRINSITTTRAGDITAMLHSPDFVGIDTISLIDGLNDVGGANITNMVTDDDLPVTQANDMVQAVSSAAPYTKSWLPVYNAPWPPAAGFPTGPDPVGNLSRFDNASTKGTWTTVVSDQGTSTGGATFNGWSMLVTPVHFDVTPFAAAVTMTATKTVSGTFRVGGTITYTVTLTNNGTANQADNSGHEFTDTLPASLTLVSANASSGTATTSGNTVNWDGALAPLGGSTTITITATVNAGTQNTSVSNQGTVSYDADGNGSNEATLLTDDPSVTGATNPTVFAVGGSQLSATQTVSGTFTTGGTVTYTITITNSGNTASPDNGANEMTETLPAALTLVSANASSGTAATTANTALWNGSVPAGGSVTITITATVNAGHLGETVNAQATVSYDSDLNGTNEATVLSDDPTVTGSANPTTFVVGGVLLTATKTVSGTFSVGGTVTYTITLSNSGPSASLDNAGNELTDTLPSSLTLTGATASAGTAAFTGNTATWNGSVPAGGTVTVTLTAVVNTGTSGSTISNQGSVSYDADLNGTNETTFPTDDPSVGGTSDPTSFVVSGATVSATKTVSGSFVAGGTVTYTVTLSNSGNAATTDNSGNEMTDVLPATLTLTGATATSGTAATSGNTVTWNGGIPAGGSVTITITATINSGTLGNTISNQASVSYDADLNGSNETTIASDDPSVGGASDPTSFVVGGARVTATKTVAGSFVPGGAVTYTVTLNNTGSSTAADNSGNEMTDVLPATLTLSGATATSGTAATSGNTVTWNGSIPAGGSVTITINATINSGTIGATVSNQATVAYDADLNGSNETTVSSDDPSVGGTSDPTTFVVGGVAMSATKTVSGTFATGTNVTYTITLSNSGSTASLNNAGNELTDVLPSSLTLVSANASAGTANATVATNTVTWNGSVPAGGSVTITIVATVKQGQAGNSISNQGTVAYDADLNGTNETTVLTDDPSVTGPANPTAFTAIQGSVPALTANKSVAGTFQTGGAITYTITIANSGNAASLDNSGNELTDVLPSSLTLVSANASSGAAVANVGTNTVTWNGSVPAAGSVTITVAATIKPGFEGSTVSNQATVLYDADLNATNETTVLSNDPSTAAPNDPTSFVVAAAVAAVPALSPALLGLLALALGLVAFRALRG
ncbi:MAG: M36 family metallopeptidase [Acidobacteria bacterium]|nr:M36 family metallopeptidase [Acidobacteriota bacterium]